MRLGVAFAWHRHPWEELLALVREAEALGYDAAFVDGDVSMLDKRREADVLDGWTVTAALLALTERISIGSIRVVHHWNAARLAQAAATAERLAPGRLLFLVSIGDRASDARFGLPQLPPAERIRWLDEALGAARRLWRGESVSVDGRHVQLRGARVRPTPPNGRIPVWIAAQRPRMLEVVAEHADGWEINLPPLPGLVQRAEAQLEAACRERGRDPHEIARSMWIFARVDESADAARALVEYRRLNPWFGRIPDEQIAPALVVGSAERCRERLAEIAGSLRLELPVIDLSGLEAAATRRCLEALAPTNYSVDAPT
ncbi:MAG: LLM class flavin-dependent oxidoreductase [Myxococcota bacterium]